MRLSADQRHDPDDRQPVPQPVHPAGERERGHEHEGRRERDDRGQDVQPELGPAVGILVEAQPERRRHEDDRGQREEAEQRREVRPAPPRDRRLEDDRHRARQAGRGDQLEEATSGVVAVGHPGGDERVLAAEQVRDLEPDEEPDHGIDDDQDDQRLGGAEPPGGHDDPGPRRGPERRARDLRDPDGRHREEPGREPRAGEDERGPARGVRRGRATSRGRRSSSARRSDPPTRTGPRRSARSGRPAGARARAGPAQSGSGSIGATPSGGRRG